MKNKPSFKHQIQDYVQSSLKCFLFKIEITSKEWHWNIGDVVEVPILAKSELTAHSIFDNAFCGSEYPCFRLVQVREIKKDFLFSLKIQRNVLDDCFDFGVEKGKRLKKC